MNYVCTDCGATKDASEFYADKRNTLKGVIARCKPCFKLRQKNYKKEVGCTQADRERSLRWRNANLEHCLEMERARRKRNPEIQRAACRKWFAEHPAERNQYKSARRVTERKAIPGWSEKQLIKVVYQKAKQLGMTVDHVVPLKSELVCGLHVWSNLQLLDRAMNTSKHNRYWPDMPEEVALSAAKLKAMTTP